VAVRSISPERHLLRRLTVDDAGGRQTVPLYARRASDAVVACGLGRLRGPALLREGGAVQEHGLAGSPLRQSAPRQRQCQR
jgi:hypothetical protein